MKPAIKQGPTVELIAIAICRAGDSVVVALRFRLAVRTLAILAAAGIGTLALRLLAGG